MEAGPPGNKKLFLSLLRLNKSYGGRGDGGLDTKKTFFAASLKIVTYCYPLIF